MANHNLDLLAEAARLLKPLLGELAFVGGCTTALLITDKAAADVRPTYDVDAIAEITSYAAYADFSERLRKIGFAEDTTEGAPICRWLQEETILDVMPLDAKILGFFEPLVQARNGVCGRTRVGARTSHPCGHCRVLLCNKAGGICWSG